jgi:acetyl-CoA acetyltransferase
VATSDRSLRGSVAIVGIGETAYYKHGAASDPEFVLTLKAILAACQDAGLDPHEIDGFASYSNDRNEGPRLAAALGVQALRFSNMQWGGGGGGMAAAVANAAAAIAAGLANRVVVFRGLAQGQFGRFGQGKAQGHSTVSGDVALFAPYGLLSPAHRHGIKVNRYMHDHGIKQDALKAIALTSYRHAQRNPRAVMHGRPLDSQAYDSARWIVEPFRLYDCCQENDGAAALLLCAAGEVGRYRTEPAYLLSAAMGVHYRCSPIGFNAPEVASAGFQAIAPDLYGTAGLGPEEIRVVQAYEHFTGGVVMSLAELGFFRPEQANEFLTLENLAAPDGRLPLNTSGGNLAECYMHGLSLAVEAVRQIRGTSVNQVPDAHTGLVTAGPLVAPVSGMILGSKEAL